MITSVSLTDFAAPVRDQGSIGDCAEEALCTSIGLISNELHLNLPSLSALYTYAKAREALNEFNIDEGAPAPVMLNAAMTYGMAPLSAWSDNPSNLYAHPAPYVDGIASNIKITGYTQVDQLFSASEMKNVVTQYISQGRPVLLSFQMHEGFRLEGGQHTFQQQLGRIYDGPNYGAHMVEIVAVGNEYGDGFPQSIGGGIIQNSWGANSAVNGFFEFGWQAFSQKCDLTFDSAFGLYVIDGLSVNGVEHNLVWSEDRKTVALGYVALMNRAPDCSGMDWWVENTLKHGVSAGDLYDDLLACPEEQLIYAGLDNAQFIDNIYINVLGREPGTDEGGRQFWTNAINDHYTRGDALNEIMQITLAYKDGSNQAYDADAIHSRDYLNNRLDVAMHFAVTYGGEDVNIAKTALIGVTDQYSSAVAANHHVWSLLG